VLEVDEVPIKTTFCCPSVEELATRHQNRADHTNAKAVIWGIEGIAVVQLWVWDVRNRNFMPWRNGDVCSDTCERKKTRTYNIEKGHITLLRIGLDKVVNKRRQVPEEDQRVQRVRYDAGVDHTIVIQLAQQLGYHHVTLLVVVIWEFTSCQETVRIEGRERE
jgi:hypothetical protein